MERDTFLFGLLVGLSVPIVGFALWLGINGILSLADVRDRFGEIFQFSLKTRVLLSVCFNLIPFQIARAKYLDNMLRGCGVTTLVMLFAWAFYFNVFAFL